MRVVHRATGERPQALDLIVLVYLVSAMHTARPAILNLVREEYTGY